MTPSKTRLGVRSLYSLNFGHAASTPDAPPPPWEAPRPPGIELLPSRLPASLVDPCYRALDRRHVCMVIERPVGCVLRNFSSELLCSYFDRVRTPRLKNFRGRQQFDFRFTIMISFFPFFLSGEGENRTTDLTLRNFTPCLRRHRGESKVKMLHNITYHEFRAHLNEKYVL